MFQPGRQKTGGRKKGVTNKTTGEMATRLAELNCDPVQELVLIARDATISQALRAKVLSDLLPYTHPRLSSVDNHHSGMTLEELVQAAYNSPPALPEEPDPPTPAEVAPPPAQNPPPAVRLVAPMPSTLQILESMRDNGRAETDYNPFTKEKH